MPRTSAGNLDRPPAGLQAKALITARCNIHLTSRRSRLKIGFNHGRAACVSPGARGRGISVHPSKYTSLGASAHAAFFNGPATNDSGQEAVWTVHHDLNGTSAYDQPQAAATPAARPRTKECRMQPLQVPWVMLSSSCGYLIYCVQSPHANSTKVFCGHLKSVWQSLLARCCSRLSQWPGWRQAYLLRASTSLHDRMTIRTTRSETLHSIHNGQIKLEQILGQSIHGLVCSVRSGRI